MKKILSCLTVLALLFTLIVPCFAKNENSSVIYIKTVKDLIELSEKMHARHMVAEQNRTS